MTASKSNLNIMLLVFAMFYAQSAALAETRITNTGSGPDICVAWNQAGNPVAPDDFTVAFTDPANPDITFFSENAVWTVYSKVDGSTVGKIGDITISAPTNSSATYGLRIERSSGPGATDVQSVVLHDPSNWTGNSSITGGSISGNLTSGLTVIKNGSGGGGVTFSIGGTAAGTLTIPIVTDVTITGALDGTLVSSDSVTKLVVGSIGSSGALDLEKINGGSGNLLSDRSHASKQVVAIECLYVHIEYT